MANADLKIGQTVTLDKNSQFHIEYPMANPVEVVGEVQYFTDDGWVYVDWDYMQDLELGEDGKPSYPLYGTNCYQCADSDLIPVEV